MANVTQHIHIERPELWTLQLQVEPGRISYTLHNRHEANSLTWGEITLDEGASSPLKAVEDAVYDNPALLDDFGSVNILVHSEHFVVMPHEQAHESALFELLAAAYPDMEGEPALDTLPQCGVCIAFEAMTGLIPFLQRTFNMAPIVHHLQPLCDYYARFCQHTLKKAGVVCQMVQVPAHAKGDAVCCVSPDKGLAFFQGLCQPFSVQSQVFCRLLFPFAVVVIRDVLHASSLDYVAVDCPNLNHLSLF